MTTTSPVTADTIYLSPGALTGALADPDTHVVLIDVRHRHGEAASRAGYQAGHLPQAHYADLRGDFGDQDAGVNGSLPLPAPERFQKTLRGWGIRDDSLVVVTTDDTPTAASRAWFTLVVSGITHARILEGGIGAWSAAGGELTTAETAPGQGTVTVRRREDLTIDADEAARLGAAGALLDGRKNAAFRGSRAEDGSVRGGHIPGAFSVPAETLFTDEHVLRSRDDILAALEGLGEGSAIRRDAGGTPALDGSDCIGTTCGGGVAATSLFIALTRAGLPAKVYIGSFSEWSSDPARPIALGDHPHPSSRKQTTP